MVIKRPLTFENKSILRSADVPKSPSLPRGFDKYPAPLAQVISENIDPDTAIDPPSDIITEEIRDRLDRQH